MQSNLIRGGAIVLVLGMLSACGGGGGGGDSSSAPSAQQEPSIRIADRSFLEGNANNSINFPITRTNGSVQSSVQYRLVANTANTNDDFIDSSGTVTFLAGETNTQITLQLVGDGTHESDEDFRVEFHSPQNARLEKSSAKVTIRNDDPEPSVSFESKLQFTAEESTGVQVRLQLSNPTDKDVVVPLNLSGTATKDLDFLAENIEELIIPALSDGLTIALNILEDNIPEGGESILLALGLLENAAAGTNTSHQVVISGQIALNDTGYTHFTNGSSYDLTVEPSSHPFQDGSHGRDTRLDDDVDGAHSMSFTKLDLDGNAVPPGDPNFSCLRDNVTGLVWEVKEGYNEVIVERDERDRRVARTLYDLSDYRSLYRSSSFRYYWYNNTIDQGNTGGSIGHQGGLISSQTGMVQDIEDTDIFLAAYIPEKTRTNRLYPNTEAFTREVNSRGLCGFKDWRLPTVSEYRSIANYDPTANPDDGFLDPNYFPHGLPDRLTAASSVEYFTSNPDADNDASAWCFNAVTGTARLCHKGTPHYVRLVRLGE